MTDGWVVGERSRGGRGERVGEQEASGEMEEEVGSQTAPTTERPWSRREEGGGGELGEMLHWRETWEKSTWASRE